MNRPVVALLTDFGTSDPFVGVMKGVLLSRCPDAAVVDLTHGIPPQAVSEGAFWLDRCSPWFPAGTVFVAVVDPGVGTARAGLVATASGQVFVGPDNGLITAALARDPAACAFAIEPGRLGLPPPSRTFHGRDVFAPVAAELARGALAPRDVGPAIASPVPSNVPEPTPTGDGADGVVVTVDRFGNLITNLEAGPDLAPGAAAVVLGARRLELHESYAALPEGTGGALVNAWGVVEVAVRGGSAERAFGVGRGAPVSLRPKASRRGSGAAPPGRSI